MQFFWENVLSFQKQTAETLGINDVENVHQSNLSCWFLKEFWNNIVEISLYAEVYTTNNLEKDFMVSFPIDLLFACKNINLFNCWAERT